MASASDDSIYELPVINMMGGLDVWKEREELGVT
jgi:hypothetical protein